MGSFFCFCFVSFLLYQPLWSFGTQRCIVIFLGRHLSRRRFPLSNYGMPLTASAANSPRPYMRSNSLRVARGRSWVKSLTTPATLRFNRTDPDLGLDCFDLLQDDSEDVWKALDDIAAFRLSLENDDEASRCSIDLPRFSVGQDDSDTADELEEPSVSTSRPFHKWMKTLHRRANRCSIGNRATEQLPECLFVENPIRINGHRKSSSGSSFGFVTAVKSATVSLASASVRTRQRRHAARSSIHTRTDHSSRGSISAQRMSEDSTCFDRGLHTDPGVTERLLQRRRILEDSSPQKKAISVTLGFS